MEINSNTTVEQIREEFLEQIRSELDNAVLEDGFDLSSYCGYAGRLASLGNSDYLSKTEAIFKYPQYKGRIDEIFNSQFLETAWDINEREGVDRGISIEIAQDLYCFKRHTSYQFSKATQISLDKMIQAADSVPLDDEAVESIEDYLDCFPIAEEDQLDVVSAPLSEQALEVLEDIYLPENPPVYPTQWDQFAQQWTISTPFGNIIVKSVSETNASTEYTITSDTNKTVQRVTQIYQGRLPWVQSDEDQSLWTANYSWLQSLSVEEIKQTDITVRFVGGARAILQPGAMQYIAASSKPVRHSLAGYYNPCMAAQGQTDKPLFIKWLSVGQNVKILGKRKGEKFLFFCYQEENVAPVSQIRFGDKTWSVDLTQQQLSLDWEEVDQCDLDDLFVCLDGSNKFEPMERQPQDREE